MAKKKYIDIFDLSNKVIVVTGGYGHLGSGIVDGLLSLNAKVIVAGKSYEKFIRIFEKTTNVYFQKLDISSSKCIEESFKFIIEEHGRIDVLFNNAHFASGKGQENMPDDDWSYTMEGVLGSVHKCIKAVIPYMKLQGSGKIINIASMYGVVSPNFNLYQGDLCEKYMNPPHYGAAKAGVIQLTKYFAVLLGKHKINVNAISPGAFPKENIQLENPNFINRLRNQNPLKRIGVPNDLVGISVLLSSNASDYITGQNIIVDGGWTIW